MSGVSAAFAPPAATRPDGATARARDGPGDRGGRHRVGAVHGPGRQGRSRCRGNERDAQDDGRDRVRGPHRHRRGRARRGADAVHRRAGRQDGAERAEVPADRHRRRPARGHEPRRPRPGRRDHRPLRARGRRPDQCARHVHGEALRRPARRGQGRHPRSARPRTSGASPTRSAGRSSDITVVILERPRHEALIAEVRAAGARIKLIGDGDLSAAISCAVSGTGVHAVMGIGGAPEGVITAGALRCLGGEIQARFRYRNAEERERGARMGHGDEDRVYTHRGPRARARTSSSPPPASRPATCSRACGSSAAARGPTRW